MAQKEETELYSWIISVSNEILHHWFSFFIEKIKSVIFWNSPPVVCPLIVKLRSWLMISVNLDAYGGKLEILSFNEFSVYSTKFKAKCFSIHIGQTLNHPLKFLNWEIEQPEDFCKKNNLSKIDCLVILSQ